MLYTQLRLVTLDVTDTLLTFRGSVGDIYSIIAGKYGIKSDSKTLQGIVEYEAKKMRVKHPNFGCKSGLGWENWWKTVVVNTFKTVNPNISCYKLDLIARELIKFYEEKEAWDFTEGSLEFLKYLQSRKRTTGVISNFDPRLPTILKNTDLCQYFDFIVYSYDVCIQKPNKEIFEEAMKQSKLCMLDPEECLHVGNSLKKDYFGAKSANWNGALIADCATKDFIKLMNPGFNLKHIFYDLKELQKCFLDKCTID